MEKAVYLKRLSSLNDLPMEDFQRVYFGAEFCENLIPSLQEINEILIFCKRYKKGFSFVSPPVSMGGVAVLSDIFIYLHDHHSETGMAVEIIINDYGVIMLLRQFPGLTKVIGRLLSKQIRDPRIRYINGGSSRTEIDELKYSQFSKTFCSFMLNNKIERVELDNPLGGIADDLTSRTIKTSLYYPYVYLTTTRLCLFNMNKVYNIPEVKICSERLCQRQGVFSLKHESMPVPILLKGNTQFYENASLPEHLEQKRIDRLIYEPEIPV